MRLVAWFGLTGVLLGGAAALGGCVADERGDTFVARAPVRAYDLRDPSTSAPLPSKMPWQLTPASTAAIAQGRADDRRRQRPLR